MIILQPNCILSDKRTRHIVFNHYKYLRVCLITNPVSTLAIVSSFFILQKSGNLCHTMKLIALKNYIKLTLYDINQYSFVNFQMILKKYITKNGVS